MKYVFPTVVLGAALIFILFAGRLLVREVPPTVADLIVPLAGETERIHYAIELYNEGFAPQFGLTVLPLKTPGLRKASREFAEHLILEGGIPETQLTTISNMAFSTRQEAENILALARSQDLDSVLVVTSAWHTRRSAFIFEQVFAGSGIAFTIVPVASDSYQPTAWWLNPKSRGDTTREYAKLLVYALGLETMFVPSNDLL